MRNWTQLAAEQGDTFAQTRLSVMYNDGRGVPQDYGKAAKWMQLAAEQGDASAQAKLGSLYINGQGVPQNCVFAYMWWTLSMAGGNEFVRNRRDAAAEKMTPAQIAEAQQLVRDRPTPSK